MVKGLSGNVDGNVPCHSSTTPIFRESVLGRVKVISLGNGFIKEFLAINRERLGPSVVYK